METASFGQLAVALDGRLDVLFAEKIPARVQLLRQMADLPLVQTLTQPGWHVLCDDAMGAALRAAGLPDSRMSGVLEHGEFLDARLPGPATGDVTLVIATRRSEQAVLGVMRLRKLRAMPLFGVLLPRLAAHAPGRLGMDAVRQAGPCARVSVRVVPHGADDDPAARVDGQARLREVVPFGRAQVALARAHTDIGFDVRAWWNLLVRAVPGVDRLVLRVSAERLGMFLAALAPADSAFVQQALAELSVSSDDYEDGAAYQALVSTGPWVGQASDAMAFGAPQMHAMPGRAD